MTVDELARTLGTDAETVAGFAGYRSWKGETQVADREARLIINAWKRSCEGCGVYDGCTCG